MADDGGTIEDEIRLALAEVDELREVVDALDPADPDALSTGLPPVLVLVESLTGRVEGTILPAVRRTGDPGEGLADAEVGLHTELDQQVSGLRAAHLHGDVDPAAWHQDVEALRATLDAVVDQLARLHEGAAGPQRRPSVRPHARRSSHGGA